MVIDSSTRFVTLLGYPLGHSLSPAIHNASFQAQGINMVYLCMPVMASNLQEALLGFRAAKFVGSNVTIPHKQAIHALVDDVSDQARAVGAVNTVVSKLGADGEVMSLYGDNTDIRGFLDPLDDQKAQLDGTEMVVLGAGGAARAVVYALLTSYAPPRLTIVARNKKKAEILANDLALYDSRAALCISDFTSAGPAIRQSHLLVNATPLGMHPYQKMTPWEEVNDFGKHQLIYDLIYNPLETRLMREATSRGAEVIGGLEMLVRQAAASYVQWTGHEMLLNIARDAALETLIPLV